MTPREMSVAEIRATVADYGTAAENARRAGFDGPLIVNNGGVAGYVEQAS